MSISRALEKAMSDANLSEVQVAAKLGVSQSTVHKWIVGAKSPRAETLLRLFVVVPGFRRLVDSRNGAVA